MRYCSENLKSATGAAHIELDSDLSAFILTARTAHLRPVADAPALTLSGGALLRDLDVLDESGSRRTLKVPIERPLTIIVDGRELVTLMTLGAKLELLTLGYLRNQRIVDHVAQIASIEIDADAGRALVTRRAGDAAAAPTFVGTACSLGTEFPELMRQAELTPLAASARLSRAQLLRILDVTREYDAIHRAAGSVHGCALFQGDELLVSLEDVSRHNGMDTVVGWMLLFGVTGADKILFTTGRLTGEMVMKAAHNDISILVSRNGVTSVGYELAKKLGMVLIGRAAKGRYLCYCGFERFDSTETTPG